jgi:hypothetical protein
MRLVLSRRSRRVALVVLALIALAALSPSYTRVIVVGDGVNIDVEKAGFGPQRVQVKTGDASVETSAR